MCDIIKNVTRNNPCIICFDDGFIRVPSNANQYDELSDKYDQSGLYGNQYYASKKAIEEVGYTLGERCPHCEKGRGIK